MHNVARFHDFLWIGLVWIGLVFLAGGPTGTVLAAGGQVASPAKTRGEEATPSLPDWLPGPIGLDVRNEVTDAAAHLSLSPGVDLQQSLAPLPLTLTCRWKAASRGAVCDFAFAGSETRLGHTVVVELPLLTPQSLIFTPSERGVMSVAAQPDYVPVPYAHLGWEDGRHYVLPLVSILNPADDTAVTIALPPDVNIPHLQVAWQDGRTVRLQLSHRGMGGEQPSPLRLLFYRHAADYRCVLQAYSEDFPRYFRPALPRGRYEGAFWYHHIHDHPDGTELARQNVRFIWSSFWFTHLGEYLPAEQEWFPYTYAKWWNLQEPMSDDKIHAFIRQMHAQDIGVFAYFNVTEYGGAGGKQGDTATAAQLLQDQFADALMKDEAGQAIPTWEGAMAMNARRDCTLFPALAEQIRRHVTRLPELDGFVIDRLDWGSRYDYGHDDALTMLGGQRVENMAGPVGEGVAEVCRQSHAAGWRVYVNQFWRLEMLRDVDGYCHESDIVRGIGYLAPLRPASAWHMRKSYQGDLLQFEGQLKRRLQFALQPQMIAHQFPISQQASDPQAADLLEIYAPLFQTLDGKAQVLTPHCVSATGANDVNLFINRRGHYVIPLTSRLRFLSRRVVTTEEVRVTLRDGLDCVESPPSAALQWAWVLSADGPPRPARVSQREDAVEIVVAQHGTASVVVAGQGPPPQWDEQETLRLATTRDRLFPPPTAPRERPSSAPPTPLAVRSAKLAISGTHLGEPGIVQVVFQGRILGELKQVPQVFHLEDASAGELAVELRTGDEGTWFVPRRMRLTALLSDENMSQVAEWTPDDAIQVLPGFGRVRYPLSWGSPRKLPAVASRYENRDGQTGGQWLGKLGSQAVWIPLVHPASTQGEFTLQSGGQPFVWNDASDDQRVLLQPAASPRTTPGEPAPQQPAPQSTASATCWFASDELPLRVTPTDEQPYRLTVYLLDFDRNGRALEAVVEDASGTFVDRQEVTADETAQGLYLTWTVTGDVTLTLRKLSGFNVVASGLFIDASSSAP